MAWQNYSGDTRQACFEAFVAGRSFADISRQFGPAKKTIESWAAQEGWEERRAQLRNSPLALDTSLCAALTLERGDLESTNREIRGDAIDRCYKIAVVRSKLKTNQVDRGPIAKALAASFKDHVKANLPKHVAPEHRQIVGETVAMLLMEWFSKVLASNEEVMP